MRIFLGWYVVACIVFPFLGFSSYNPTFQVDLKGQITNASHGEASTRIDISVRTAQRDPYPFATSIVVACYDAKQYDIRQRLVAWSHLQIQGISSTKAAYVSLDIPKVAKEQTILCHIDDTNIVPEINDSNQVGWIHVGKGSGSPSPTPALPTPIPLPQLPLPTPDPSIICRHGYCGKPLPPVARPPVHKPSPPVHKPSPPVHKPSPPVRKPSPPVRKPSPPVRKPTPPVHKTTPPVYVPTSPPKRNTTYVGGRLSPCFGSDCDDYYYDYDYYNQDKQERRRIVDPPSINTSFKWLSRVR